MTRAGTICAECPQPAVERGRCAAHAAAYRAAVDRRRPRARQRGYGARWERTRRRKLRLTPNCERCGAPATDVHHLDGLGPNGPDGHELWNLESLCKSHHSRTTSAEQPGGFRT
jgi:5-methylcytosine-specific restriction protein A